ncbi:MAG TPA: hypothetical protein VJS64_09265 [Pyrinomonadaceae bacterium]|nr:hypothetical protein [Pyrinomonadaceae bacterium]
MGREQMRNLETFKVGTNAVNEFEYQQNQGQLTEQLEHQRDQQNSLPEATTEADRIQRTMAEAHEKVEERKRRGASSFGKGKSATKKPAAKQSAAKKSAARKSSAKRSAASRLAAKKSAKKSVARKSAAKKSGKKSGKKSAKARKR